MSKRVVATLLLALILILSATAPASENIESISLRIHKSRDYTPSQYQPHSPIEISRNSDFDTLGFAGNGSIENPYIIANFSISSSTATSISIRDTTAYFIIYNCLVEAGSNGVAIQFNEVQNGRIESCEIGGGNTGIVLIESSFCTVSNTMIYYCSTGIHLYSTNNSTIIFSRLFNNYRSVRIDESLFCNIVNSSIYANTREAIDLGNFAFNNSIYGNSIGWNGDSGNVIDLGHHNHFDDGVGLGNAWDDFNGSIPFVIPGTNGSIDSYPQLLVDNVNPVIYGLADIAFDIETTGNSMTWMVSDDFPNTYSIQIDNGPDSGHAWNGDNITIDLDTLRVGTYRFVLTLFDGAGNTASDEVYVSAVSFVLGGIGTELVMIASGITVVYFAVIILMIKKLS